MKGLFSDRLFEPLLFLGTKQGKGMKQNPLFLGTKQGKGMKQNPFLRTVTYRHFIGVERDNQSLNY
jgi:hypothetical protein